MATKRKLVLAGLAVLVAASTAGGITLWRLNERAESAKALGTVVPGVLFRSAQPTVKQLDRLRRHTGLATVVSLREDPPGPDVQSEEVAYCRSRGIRYVNIPIGTDIPSDEQLMGFLREAITAPKPMLVHCEHGRSRTGKLVAAYRMVFQDIPLEAAVAEMGKFKFVPDAEELAWLRQVQDRRTQIRAELSALSPNALSRVD